MPSLQDRKYLYITDLCYESFKQASRFQEQLLPPFLALPILSIRMVLTLPRRWENGRVPFDLKSTGPRPCLTHETFGGVITFLALQFDLFSSNPPTALDTDASCGWRQACSLCRPSCTEKLYCKLP